MSWHGSHHRLHSLRVQLLSSRETGPPGVGGGLHPHDCPLRDLGSSLSCAKCSRENQ